MKTICSSLLLASLAGLFLHAPACAASYELSFQSMYAPTHASNINVLVPWAESFAKLTNGDLVVNFYPSEAIVESRDAFNALKTGMLDMGYWAPTRQPKSFPYSMLCQLPLLVHGPTHSLNTYWKMYEEIPEFKRDLDSAGPLLSLWGPAPTALFSVKAPIRTPADIHGKRILTILPNDTELIKAIGGVPVYVAPGDVYVGLQRGMGEAYYCALPYASGQRIMEVTKYVTILPLSGGLMPISINQMIYDMLPEKYRTLIMEQSGRALAEAVCQSLEDDIGKSIERFSQAGAEIIYLSEAEMAPFRQKIETLIDSYWIPLFKEYGVKDPERLIEQSYAISNSVLAAE